MDIKSMLQGLSQGEDNKKKYIVIALIILFLLSLVGTSVYFLTKTTTTPTTNDNDQLLSDFGKLAPRDGVATSTLKRLPLIELTSDRSAVAPGQPTKISWSASNATSCINGKGDEIALVGDLSVSPKEPYTFDILCTGPYGIQSQSITIGVTTAPIIELIATPSSVLSGKQSYISWDTTNADRCEDSEGKTLRLSSGFSVKPTSDYTFKMSCVGEKGTTTKTVTIKIVSSTLATNNGSVPSKIDTTTPINTSPDSGSDTISWETDGTIPDAAATVTLTAVPQSIDYNKSTSINWTVKNVTYCVFTSDGTLGSLPPFVYTSGSRTIPKLSTTQKFTLTCTKGTDKVAKTVTVTVGPAPVTPEPKILTFSITPGVAATFGTLKASWTTSNAKTCTLSKGSEVYKTFLPTSYTGYPIYENKAGTHVYTLSCTNPSGTSTSDPISIAVVDCTFKDGFGSEPNKTINGVVEPGSKYGRSEAAICTYTFGNPKGSAATFAQIWNLFGYGDGSQFPVNASPNIKKGNQFLCNFTRYTRRDTASGGSTFGDWHNNTPQPADSIGPSHGGYHSNWQLISFTTDPVANGINSLTCLVDTTPASETPHIGSDNLGSYSGGNTCDGTPPPTDTCDGRLSNAPYSSCGATQNLGPCTDVANYHYQGGGGYCHYPYLINSNLTCKP